MVAAAVKEWWTIEEVAGKVGVSSEFVRIRCEDGRIPSIVVNESAKRKLRRIHITIVDALIESMRKRGTQKVIPVDLNPHADRTGCGVPNLLGIE